MEAQEHSDHRQVEDKHAVHTDLVYRRSNQEVIRGSSDRVARVLACSRGTSWVLRFEDDMRHGGRPTLWYRRGARPLLILLFACKYPNIKNNMISTTSPPKIDHLTIRPV
jgi:hypothetical protein